MTWHDRVNKVIDYIEENLCQQIDFAEIAKIAGQSQVVFQRTFSIVADISIYEYIRRRRLSLAGFDIQNTNQKVVDIALKYGYESPESFTRAFKELHGASPAAARKKVLSSKIYPRITFLLSIKGAVVMEYRIEKKDAFKIYGVEGIFTVENDAHLKDLPAFWQKFWQEGDSDRLMNSMGNPDAGVHAIGGYKEMGEKDYPYMIFAHLTKGCDADGFATEEIPAATWAVFRSEKHDVKDSASVIQALFKRVYTEWLPSAPFVADCGCEQEIYVCAGDGMLYSEVWLCVTPK
ncbi:MAG: AraC family transcriptional regulator [Defluviitaleaceae bacterium]|nr:AraC family transcriptional regulator [Defluviitaleaceae bacterium]